MKLTEDEINEITEVWYELAEEYIEGDSTFFSSPHYMDIFTTHMYEYILMIAMEEDWVTEDEDEDELFEWVTSFCMSFLEEYSIPLRQSTCTFTNPTTLQIEKTIERILSFPVQVQRSAEWYALRYDRFSASNLWKLFGSPSQVNSLIYEKCKGHNTEQPQNNDVLMPNARNWGIKYEPVTVQIYEDMFHTKVNTNFGCLPHPTLPIGASPDGIVTDDPSSERYGRLVEIKNIFNRDIDGIPSEEYWIQMQTQLEVCQLEMCDFVETRFKEYPTYEGYVEDATVKYKGIILFYLAKNPETHKSKHVYMPLSITDSEEWIEKTSEELRDSHVLYEKNYWYLDEISCVQVERNAVWFNGAIPTILLNWEVVLKERKEGFEHRAPKSRTNKKTDTIEYSSHIPPIVKLVKLDWH